ncbi:MAG: c-type cytochrome [Acidobacteriota bacterium]
MVRVTRGLYAAAVATLIALSAAGVAAQAPPAAVPAEAKKLKNPVAASAASVDAGAKLYAKYCRFCHGTTGRADSAMAPKNMKPSNLADATWDRGSSDGEIFWVIENGAPPAYDMKGLKGKLAETDMWHLVNFVRSLSAAKPQ